MDLKKLEGFRALAKYGNLRTAAARRGVTIPALSIQIKKLEEELGIALFDRRMKQLVLTDRGRVFLKEIDLAFDALQRAKNTVLDPASDFIGSVSVSMATDLARYFAPKIANFVNNHPQLNVTILVRTQREAIDMVQSGEIDMGIGFVGRIPKGITKIRIFETDIHLVVPKDHPLGRRKKPSLAEVAAFRLVMPRRDSASRRMIDATLAGSGIDLPNIIEVGRCQTTMDFVGLGLGVGFVHGICAAMEPNNKLTQINMSHHFGKTEIALFTRSSATFRPAQRALMEIFLSNSVKQRRTWVSR